MSNGNYWVGRLLGFTSQRKRTHKIYAFKPQPYRFLCFFFEGSKIIITNAFMKKQHKLPKAEKERALRSKADYEHRVKEGKYYG